MKKFKKIIYFVIVLVVISAIVDVFDQKALKENDKVENPIDELPIEMATVQDTSIEITSFDDLYKRADDVRSSAFKLELRGTEQIDFITIKVSEDIPSDLDKEITLDALKYVITEYENERFKKNAPVNLYITRFLDKQLDKYPDLAEADSMVFDMFQICKEFLRMSVKDVDDMMARGETIAANEEQIDEILESVKLSFN